MTPPIKWPWGLTGTEARKTHPEFVGRIEAESMKNQTRPLDRHSVVTLRGVTKNNLRAISFLDVGPGQEGLVAPNAFSIAQAHFYPEAWFRAIYADETPVGFVMLEDRSQVADGQPALHQGENSIALWRFMIDARYQQFGFGTQAILLLIAHAKSRPGVTTLLLSFVPKENNPEVFYQRFGFARTGEVDDGEIVMSRKLV